MAISEKEVQRKVASVIKLVHDLRNSSPHGQRQISCINSLDILNSTLLTSLESENVTVKHCRLEMIFIDNLSRGTVFI